MAKITSQSILPFVCILVISTPFISARDMPDVKDPDSFINPDHRSFLIPGVGRVMVPDHKKGFNPFTYNPITGKSGNNSGTGVSNPGIIGGGTGPSFVPGGDDTYVSNPGVEVPASPGTTGGNVPVPSASPP